MPLQNVISLPSIARPGIGGGARVAPAWLAVWRGPVCHKRPTQASAPARLRCHNGARVEGNGAVRGTTRAARCGRPPGWPHVWPASGPAAAPLRTACGQAVVRVWLPMRNSCGMNRAQLRIADCAHVWLPCGTAASFLWQPCGATAMPQI